MITAAVIGVGGVAVGGAAVGAAGTYAMYRKSKKNQKMKKNTAESEQQEKLECLSWDELLLKEPEKKRDKFLWFALACKAPTHGEAFGYHKKASSMGHLGARCALGRGFKDGAFQPQSEEMALDHFLSASEHGHEDSTIEAARIYESRENWKEAKRMYRRLIRLELADDHIKERHGL